MKPKKRHRPKVIKIRIRRPCWPVHKNKHSFIHIYTYIQTNGQRHGRTRDRNTTRTYLNCWYTTSIKHDTTSYVWNNLWAKWSIRRIPCKRNSLCPMYTHSHTKNIHERHKYTLIYILTRYMEQTRGTRYVHSRICRL